MKKLKTITIRLSSEELRKIKLKSDKVGMSVSGFIRFLALRVKPNVITND